VNPWHTFPCILPAYEHILMCHIPRGVCVCVCAGVLSDCRLVSALHAKYILHIHTRAGVQDLIGELVKTKEMNMNVSFTCTPGLCRAHGGCVRYATLNQQTHGKLSGGTDHMCVVLYRQGQPCTT